MQRGEVCGGRGIGADAIRSVDVCVCRVDRPAASMDAALKAKQKRVDWRKGDKLAKLEGALTKWKEKVLDENGEALSIHAFANIEGIPERTFRRLVARQSGARERCKEQ